MIPLIQVFGWRVHGTVESLCLIYGIPDTQRPQCAARFIKGELRARLEIVLKVARTQFDPFPRLHVGGRSSTTRIDPTSDIAIPIALPVPTVFSHNFSLCRLPHESWLADVDPGTNTGGQLQREIVDRALQLWLDWLTRSDVRSLHVYLIKLQTNYTTHLCSWD